MFMGAFTVGALTGDRGNGEDEGEGGGGDKDADHGG